MYLYILLDASNAGSFAIIVHMLWMCCTFPCAHILLPTLLVPSLLWGYISPGLSCACLCAFVSVCKHKDILILKLEAHLHPILTVISLLSPTLKPAAAVHHAAALFSKFCNGSGASCRGTLSKSCNSSSCISCSNHQVHAAAIKPSSCNYIYVAVIIVKQ